MDYQRPEDSGAGELIGQRYALGRRLREEPWGAVWLAQDQLLEAEVALKLLDRETAEWAAAQRAFEQEAVLALKLRHPQILGVYFLGKTDRILYLVQEPFTGESLLSQLIRQRHFALPQALELLERVSRPLAWAHRQGVVHRSFSPLNVLAQGDEVRLANFAFPPADGDQVMHLEIRAYEPPEVLQGDVLTPAGNVFSLGVLGFRLAAGSLPYALTFDEPFPYRLETPPVDLEEIPLPLQNFLLQCLAVDPEERLPDAGAFLTQLRQVREQMHPGRREARGAWGDNRSPRVRQAAAQAGAWLGKLREAGPVGKKVWGGAQASWQAMKSAPRRLWSGLGLVVLIVVLLLWGGLKTSRTVAPPPAPEATGTPVPPAPEAKGGPVPPAPMSGSPPLTAGEERPAAPAARPGGAPAPPPGAEAKTKAAQGRYLLLAATYADQKQAQALLKRLQARKYRAKVVKQTSGGKTLYQVQVGPVTGSKAAEEAARNLKSQEKITPRVVKMTPGKNTKKNGGSVSQRSSR